MPKELASILDLANSNLFPLLYRIHEFIAIFVNYRIARIVTIQNTELWWTPTVVQAIPITYKIY